MSWYWAGAGVVYPNGKIGGLWDMSFNLFTVIIYVICAQVLLVTVQWNVLVHLAFFVGTLLAYALFVIAYNFFFLNSPYYGMAEQIFTGSIGLWAVQLLIIIACVAPAAAVTAWRGNKWPTRSQRLLREVQVARDRRYQGAKRNFVSRLSAALFGHAFAQTTVLARTQEF
mmetsp:Transcript_87660/g.200290  ORF Transcript_87660/g.200290 Transcript_87660/m.200290 type:complete len:170 (-) Transcript_87660:242-751(-)